MPLLSARSFHVGAPLWESPLTPSSKVEETVKTLQQQQGIMAAPPSKVVAKKSLKQRVIDEIVHYYHGFRLLFIDVKISTSLVTRVLNGKTLTRRETRLLRRTVGDLFRLVPFSVFIIVPFMEFLLPFFIKFFPGMLPSTFQTATEREDKIKQSLKVKLEMAKFLQQTLDDMALQSSDHNSQQAKEFAEWFIKIRSSGEKVSNQEILKFSKLFRDEITLDSLSRSQLVALCRVLEVQTLGTNHLLRFQLRMKLRSLAADDKLIEKEGVDSLTSSELQQACRARGMRAYGLSEERLKIQLTDWLILSLHEKVPPSLLLLSRALMLPETIPTEDKLKATISVLSPEVVVGTKAAIGETEGKIDNKVRLEVIKEEERRIKEERLETKEAEKKEKEILMKTQEQLIDKAPILMDTAKELNDPAEMPKVIQDPPRAVSTDKVIQPVTVLTATEGIKSKDIKALKDAIVTMSKEKSQPIVEKKEIEELKEQMADYQEDVQDLQKTVAQMPKPDIKESKAAKRLYNRVNTMIGRMDKVLMDLETKEKKLREQMQAKTKPAEAGAVEPVDPKQKAIDKSKEELLKIDEIMMAIRKIKDVPDESRLNQIANVLAKMDDDRDGSIKIEDVLKVIEFIGKEDVQLNPKQIDELVELLDKEEIIEVEDKIERALAKEKETKQAVATAAKAAAAAVPIPDQVKLAFKTAEMGKEKAAAAATPIAGSIDRSKPATSETSKTKAL